MKRNNPVVLTNMCMIYSGTKVLVQNKIDDKEKGIVFPGGHVECMESVYDSVIREMKEETGLTIYNPILCGLKEYEYDTGKRYIVFLFKTNEFSGELHSSCEGDVFWIEKADLLSQNLIWDMEEMLEVFDKDSITEYYAKKVGEEWLEQIV